MTEAMMSDVAPKATASTPGNPAPAATNPGMPAMTATTDKAKRGRPVLWDEGAVSEISIPSPPS